MHNGAPSSTAAGEQPAIGAYAAIGDCRTLALVSHAGSIDWWCWPAFDAPSVFAALLDARVGGRFALGLPGAAAGHPSYERGTNVLHTRLADAAGAIELIDCMAMHAQEGGGTLAEGPQEIVRIARCVEGTAELQLVFEPRPGYATQVPAFRPAGPGRWIFEAAGAALELWTTATALRESAPGRLEATLPLRAGESHAFVLRAPAGDGSDLATAAEHAEQAVENARRWWLAWSGRCAAAGPHAQAVERSGLALKLLTHAPTGAVVAAPTTSLPESDTGERNWDYRFCWLRDASLVLQAFVELGHLAEGDAFLRWLLHATRSTQPRLQIVYDVRGAPLLPEQELPQLAGYRGIGPVRIGNAASAQAQNDVYGEVLLSARRFVAHGGHLDAHEKRLLANFAQMACRVWREPDHGLWEIRLPPRHNTHSKLMCWAAVDTALWLQAQVGLPVDAQHLAREREAIRAEIEAHAFDARLGSYVGYYGGTAADASLLLIPRVGYLPPNDARMQGTLRHILRTLQVDGLLYRYPPGGAYDGVAGPEHLFAICGFWCVECLARQGRLDEAQRMFERLLALRNPVGLYAEEFRVGDGTPMGNFPQAFSHVGLITAALALAKAGA
ncbi:glycoside hydrolase family 15 protein [Ramlibacter alkalitolerans]|uniref:Glycoside hydrolase family 15 protein n=1 Tax=Ramlibacter alkalitolerans TaxID=2039631 RepID=A0ABS1JIE1_9BURK|nr:glycoside hydrolase family 15 protein [Ramlibacter alkalitolerans]MBL0423967.1 glycoside hydrolase family 15 protein [Ramlibacter alkalitolerans]